MRDTPKIEETSAEAVTPTVKAVWTPPCLRRIDALDAQVKVNPGVELHAHLTS